MRCRRLDAGKFAEFGRDVASRSGIADDGENCVVTRDSADDSRITKSIERRRDNMRAPWRRAEYDDAVVVGDVNDKLAHQTPEMIVAATGSFLGVLRDRIRHCSTGDAYFDRAKVFKVTADRRLRGNNSFGFEELHQLCLTRHWVVFKDPQDSVLTLWSSERCHLTHLP